MTCDGAAAAASASLMFLRQEGSAPNDCIAAVSTRGRGPPCVITTERWLPSHAVKTRETHRATRTPQTDRQAKRQPRAEKIPPDLHQCSKTKTNPFVPPTPGYTHPQAPALSLPLSPIPTISSPNAFFSSNICCTVLTPIPPRRSATTSCTRIAPSLALPSWCA